MIRRRVNTDLPPLKSGEHKISNIEWTTNLNLRINNLHVMKWVGVFRIDEHRINNTGWIAKWWWNGGWNEKQNHWENAERFSIYIFLHQ